MSAHGAPLAPHCSEWEMTTPPSGAGNVEKGGSFSTQPAWPMHEGDTQASPVGKVSTLAKCTDMEPVWLQILAQPFISCVTLGKLLNISVP